MWYNFWMTNRWLLLHFDALGAGAVLVTTLLALNGLVGGGMAGFVITSSMTFTSNIYWACRFWTQLELDLKYVLFCFTAHYTCNLMSILVLLSVLWST